MKNQNKHCSFKENETYCSAPAVSNEDFCEIHLPTSRTLIDTGALTDISSPISRLGLRSILKCPCANYIHAERKRAKEKGKGLILDRVNSQGKLGEKQQKKEIEQEIKFDKDEYEERSIKANLFDCKFVNFYYTDFWGEGRCILEVLLFNSLWDKFHAEYELDPVADKLSLERLILNIVRLSRLEGEISSSGEKIFVPVYQNGKLIYEIREHYFNSIINSLDIRTEKWLNALKLSRKSRSDHQFDVRLDWSNLLSEDE